MRPAAIGRDVVGGSAFGFRVKNRMRIIGDRAATKSLTSWNTDTSAVMVSAKVYAKRCTLEPSGCNHLFKSDGGTSATGAR